MLQLKLIDRYRVLSVLSIAAVFLLSSAAQAQSSRSFRISGGGVAPNGLKIDGDFITKHEAMGEATHLGRHQGMGAFVLLRDKDGALNGQFQSNEPFVFVAANGDKLVTHYGNTTFGATQPGTYQITFLGATQAGQPIVSVVFLAEFVVQPASSTGRFRGTTGSWIMEARTAPFLLGSDAPTAYEWEGRGRISLPRR